MFQFSSVQWEGAGRGGDSSSSAACPPAAWFNVKPLFGLCFSGPVNSSEGRKAASPGTGMWGRDRLSWDTLYCSCEHWFSTTTCQSCRWWFSWQRQSRGWDGFGAKGQHLYLVHTFLRHGISRWLADAGRIGNVLKDYYFFFVYEKISGERSLLPVVLLGKYQWSESLWKCRNF